MDAHVETELTGAHEIARDPADTLELVRYWRAIKRHHLGIIVFVIAAGIIAAIYASTLQPIYRGTATVLLDPVRKKSMSNEELYEGINGTPRDYYLTQIEIMKSRDFAERLVQVLNLTRHPDYDPRLRREKATSWFGTFVNAMLEPMRPAATGGAAGDTQGREEIREGAIAHVMGQLSFQPVRNTQLVKVSFDTPDPLLAERVPNTLAMLYIMEDLKNRDDSAGRSWAFLASQADELKKKLSDSEQALQQYRESQKIVVARGASLTDATRRLDEATKALEAAHAKRLEAESIYRQVSATASAPGQSTSALESLAVLQRNPALLKMRETELEAERKFSEASKRYGPDHPTMVAAQTNLNLARDAVRRQIATVVQSVAKDYEVASANETSLEQSLGRAKGEVQAFNRAEFPLARLERDVESNRRLYEAFMQRTKEVKIGDMKDPIARVVDVALLPKDAIGPNVNRIVGLAMLGALLFAVAIALLVERLDNKLRTSDDVEARLGVKAVGVLPLMNVDANGLLERMVIDDNANTFSEAIRTVRSVVQMSLLDVPDKTVLVTSTVPDEGKTTVACNLALAFSQVKKTLLIEADMRRPKVRRVLGIGPEHPGLSEFVAGDMGIEQCIFPIEGSSLSVLHSGKVPLNPLEMLSSQRFADAMRALHNKFDVIVIDSPPTQLVSDAMVLSRFATEVLFVVRAGTTPYPLARRSIIRMQRVNAPVLGAVLNQFDVERALRYYGDYSGMEAHYYHRYGYTYGADVKRNASMFEKSKERLLRLVKAA